jgi:hypothetical protein
MELDGKIPPPSEVAPFKRLLRSIQTEGRALQQLDRLTGSGQWGRAAILVRARSWREMRKLRQSATAEEIRCGGARSNNAILTAVARRASDGAAAASYYFAKPLSPAQFVGKLEHMCMSARAQLEDITSRKPTSLPDAASMISTLTVSLDGWLQQLRELTPPPSIAAPYRDVLGKLRRDQRAMHNLDELASSGQWQRAEALIRSPGWQAMLHQFGPLVKPADIRCG